MTDNKHTYHSNTNRREALHKRQDTIDGDLAFAGNEKKVEAGEHDVGESFDLIQLDALRPLPSHGRVLAIGRQLAASTQGLSGKRSRGPSPRVLGSYGGVHRFGIGGHRDCATYSGHAAQQGVQVVVESGGVNIEDGGRRR